jgi:hypothetical protein
MTRHVVIHCLRGELTVEAVVESDVLLTVCMG